MTVQHNGSNGRLAYAAALIVAPLAEDDILDLVRRGFTVRPFLEVDSAVTDLVLGRGRELSAPANNPVQEPIRVVRADPPSPTDRTYTGEFASQICTRLDPSLPNGPIRDFVHLCARKTRKRLSVDQAAQAIGIERAKLTSLIADARYPGPDEIIRWLRLLHAIWLLGRTPRRSIDEVAKSLDFASGPSMSNTMKNVIGMRPTEIAEQGGYDVVLATFRRMLEPANPLEA